MLRELVLSPVTIPEGKGLPDFLQPLLDAAAQGHVNLNPVVQSVVEAFGFDHLTYGATAETLARPDRELRAFVYTTLDSKWVARYDALSYVEVDPRAQDTWETPIPLVWDQSTFTHRSERTKAFLADALAHGVGSGVTLSFHFGAHRHVMFALSSKAPLLTDARRSYIDRRLGDIYLFGTTFHAIFMKGAVEAGVSPVLQGAPLSEREKECLGYVAKGLPDEETARLMDITVAMVARHMLSIRSKLGAANRAEAASIATKAGIVRV